MTGFRSFATIALLAAAVGGAAKAAPGPNPALGRWQMSEGNCAELELPEFTADSVILRRIGHPDMVETVAITYSNMTPTRVTVTVAASTSPARSITLTFRDPQHLVVSSAGRSDHCTLVRR